MVFADAEVAYAVVPGGYQHSEAPQTHHHELLRGEGCVCQSMCERMYQRVYVCVEVVCVEGGLVV